MYIIGKRVCFYYYFQITSFSGFAGQEERTLKAALLSMREVISECTFSLGQYQDVRHAQSHTCVLEFTWLKRNTGEERAPKLNYVWLRFTFLSAALLYFCLCLFLLPSFRFMRHCELFWKGFMAAHARSTQQITHFTALISSIRWVFFIFCTPLAFHYSNLKGFAYQSQEKNIFFVVGLKWGFHQLWSTFFWSPQHEK